MLSSIHVCIIVGSVLGFLSGMGIGGGSLLILWLTLILGFDQTTARSVNLLFFLPPSAISCIFRIRQGTLTLKKCLPAIVCGCITAAAGSLIAGHADVRLLRKPFGILLLLTGFREILYRPHRRR